VLEALAARYWDLERYVRVTYKPRDELREEILFKAVAKILRLQDKWTPQRATVWTWMVMIARGVAVQEFQRDAARAARREQVLEWVPPRPLDPLELLVAQENEGLREDRVQQAAAVRETRRTASTRKHGVSPSRTPARGGGTPS